MAYRPTLAQVRYRLKKELVRKLEAAAKRNKQSVNEEVAARLLDSFEHNYAEWRKEKEMMIEEREALITAMMTDLRSHPNPTATKAALGKMEESAERHLVQNEIPDLVRPPDK